MQFEHAGHKDEELMTDVQFLEYKRVRDELEAAKQEIEVLRAEKGDNLENGMTDYQFKYMMELKDENAALKKEIAMLRTGQENK